MARSVFFSFHWDNDVWRAMNVRQSGRFLPGQTVVEWYDRGVWETAKAQGANAIKRLIDAGLRGTSVTCVLIGSQTDSRPWVRYEIEKSWNDGKGLLGVRIHHIEDRSGRPSASGPNPFDSFAVASRPLAELIPIYDWVLHDGRVNLGTWVEAAATARGR